MVAGDWTKQSIYLLFINCFHQKSKDATASILLIDDDSGKGIYQIKNLCEQSYLGKLNAFVISAICSWLIPSGSKPIHLALM